MFKRNSTKRGFTLIELLVVIAIIGILSSVVLASLNSARKKSRDARRVADIKQIQLALEMYFDACKAYPTALALGTNNGSCPSGVTLGSFIPVVPTDPSAGAAYSYGYSGTTYYHLGATMEESSASALSTDKDCNSTGTSCPAGVAYTSGFDGTATLVYDVVP
ncbi:type II secretion system protein [Candidatus Parcubacteria bacterium]|nr:MAG: type II secretion system protein [Candidatus Parcubacteria bacterium]